MDVNFGEIVRLHYYQASFSFENIVNFVYVFTKFIKFLNCKAVLIFPSQAFYSLDIQFY